MAGSRTIQVRKRDGTQEPFDRLKLAGALWRPMQATGGRYCDARDLASAIELHLQRTRRETISSLALFEMVLTVLRRVRMADAGEALQVHRLCRTAGRKSLMVRHEGANLTMWDKSWLSEHVRRAWGLSQKTARLIASHVEADLLESDEVLISRGEVIAMMNECVGQFGLADAMPLHRQAAPRPAAQP